MSQSDEPVFDRRLLQRLHRPLEGPGVHRAWLADSIFDRVDRMSPRSALVERLTRQLEIMRAEDGELPLVVEPLAPAARAQPRAATVRAPVSATASPIATASTSQMPAASGVIQAKAAPGGLLAQAAAMSAPLGVASSSSSPAEPTVSSSLQPSSSFEPSSSTSALVETVAAAVEAVDRAEQAGSVSSSVSSSVSPVLGIEAMPATVVPGALPLVSSVDRSPDDSLRSTRAPADVIRERELVDRTTQVVREPARGEGATQVVRERAHVHADASQDQRVLAPSELPRVSPKRAGIHGIHENHEIRQIIEQLEAPTLILHDARIVERGATTIREGQVVSRPVVLARAPARWQTIRETPVVRIPPPGPARPAADEDARRQMGPSVVAPRLHERELVDSLSVALEPRVTASSSARESSPSPTSRSSERSFTSQVNAATRSEPAEPQPAQPVVARAPTRTTQQHALDEDALAQRLERKILHRWMLERERRGIF